MKDTIRIFNKEVKGKRVGKVFYVIVEDIFEFRIEQIPAWDESSRIEILEKIYKTAHDMIEENIIRVTFAEVYMQYSDHYFLEDVELKPLITSMIVQIPRCGSIAKLAKQLKRYSEVKRLLRHILANVETINTLTTEQLHNYLTDQFMDMLHG